MNNKQINDLPEVTDNQPTQTAGALRLTVSAARYNRPVGKEFRMDGDRLAKPKRLTRPPKGEAMAKSFDSFEEYAAWRKELGAETMLFAGTFEDEINSQTVGYKAEGGIAASKEYLAVRPRPGVGRIDYDVKSSDDVVAMYPPEPIGFTSHEALIEAFEKSAPGLSKVAMLVMCSSSSNLSHTGRSLKGAGGRRIEFPIEDGRLIPKVLRRLHERSILAGYGWSFVDQAGRVHHRSLVDEALARPTQPDFAAAHLLDGIEADRDFAYFEGRSLTGADIPALTAVEREQFEAIITGHQRELETAASRQKARAREARIKSMVGRGTPEKRALAVTEALDGGFLLPGALVHFADSEGGLETVDAAALLFEGAAYDGRDCRDVLEPDYDGGRLIARFYWNDGVGPRIHSFAHGSTSFRIMVDQDTLLERLREDDSAPAHLLAHLHGTRSVRELTLIKVAKAVGLGNRTRTLAADAEAIRGRMEAGALSQTRTGVELGDFMAHMPDHRYIYIPTRQMWPAESVNARVHPWPTSMVDGEEKAIMPSRWLDQNSPVEQMTWMPGEATVIVDKLIDNGGWFDRPGAACFNQYRAPGPVLGRPDQAGPWIEHVERVYPSDAGHIISWLAHRIQRPGEKVNHALVLGGKPGIGKDTLLEPVKVAVGPWNCNEVAPSNLLGSFNGFAKSVILRISEARDLGESDRFKFYDHTKTIIAAPPDVIRVNEKHLREYSVPNVCGVVLTTNHKTDGLFLPADDRRHFVAWSETDMGDFNVEYWNKLWAWYFNGGFGHVAAYLTSLDLTDFDAKAPPPKTDAFWHIVNAARPAEEEELAGVLQELEWPDAVTVGRLRDKADHEFCEWLVSPRTRKQIMHRMEGNGYVKVKNIDAEDGLYKVDGKRQVVYAREELSLQERYQAALSM